MSSKRTNVLFIEQVGTANVQLDYVFWRGGNAAFFSDTVPLGNVVETIANLPQPDVAVCRPLALDHQWLKLPERIKSRSASTKALFVCPQVDQSLANKILRAGADGISLASDDESEMSSAIGDVLSGSFYLSEDIFGASCAPTRGEKSRSIRFTHRRAETCGERQPTRGAKASVRTVKPFRRMAASVGSLETVGA